MARNQEGKFKNIIIASDMDGTFLTDQEKGKVRNHDRIEYFKQQGGYFTFSTGRSPQQILTHVPNVTELVNLPVVTCNGSCLYDFFARKELLYYPIAHEISMELADTLRKRSNCIGLRGGNATVCLYHDLNNPYIQSDYHTWSSDMRLILPVEQWEPYCINKIAVRAEESVLTQIRPLLQAQFQGRLEITRSAPTLLDIQAAGRTKAILLKELIARFERPMYLCVVGDYDNDLEMLSLADLPCCPANAIEAVKAVAKHCFCSNHDGVVADLIDYLDQITES